MKDPIRRDQNRPDFSVTKRSSDKRTASLFLAGVSLLAFALLAALAMSWSLYAQKSAAEDSLRRAQEQLRSVREELAATEKARVTLQQKVDQLMRDSGKTKLPPAE